MMLTAEYLRHHIDALLRLSRDVRDPAVSAKLQVITDEFRIIVSVADVTGLAADLKSDIPLVPSMVPPRPVVPKPADVVLFKGPHRLSTRQH
jgi:hypothetical protein